MTKKCNPGIGAVPVNVIMIVLQIGPTYQTCINFAEKLMVLRCYDHNLIESVRSGYPIEGAAALGFRHAFFAVHRA